MYVWTSSFLETTLAGQIDGATSGKQKAQTLDADNAFEAYFVLCAKNISQSYSIGLPQTATATGFHSEEATASEINLHFPMCGEMHMVVILESVLKKQKRCEEWAVANKVEIEALKKRNVANRNLIFSGAKQYIHEYQAHVDLRGESLEINTHDIAMVKQAGQQILIYREIKQISARLWIDVVSKHDLLEEDSPFFT
ncbi:60S ribosomal protein L7-2 [Tanacetum coccineum]